MEQPIHLKEIHEDLYGTADTVVRIPYYKLMVFDLKTGVGERVVQENNAQAKFYGLREWLDGDYANAEIYIVQPRINAIDTTPYIASAENMEQFAVELRRKVLATKPLDAPLIPSEEACRWCEAKVECPAQRALVEQTMLTRFDNLDEVKPPPVTTLTPEQVASVLNNSKIIELWLKSVWEYARNIDVPGYKLVKNTGTAPGLTSRKR